jgi:hypothetical protein
MHLAAAFLALLALTVGLPATSRAEAPLHAYALVIGSNRGGAGQARLEHAEGDAERMAELLVELGRTPPDQVMLLRQPTAEDVQNALDGLRQRVALHAERGEPSQVVFYYSGHARAQALSLGAEELSLEHLRSALLSLPSTLTVVVLDACQSGAFSGVKGATPAADFSVSSTAGLHSEGIAVMASSTGSELSQESNELGSGYFTHHLLVALRGAGDKNQDGRVALDEAYAYAYQNTLSDTARTQVGTQHATLETDLTGRGDVPLTYPTDADAHLRLPADMEGRILVQKERRGPVMAELIKGKGHALMLALPHGPYDVLLREPRRAQVLNCAVTLAQGQTHELSTKACKVVAEPETASKGRTVPKRDVETWFVEGGFSANAVHQDAYDHTLRTFRFFAQDNAKPAGGFVGSSDWLGYEAAAGFGVNPFLSLLLRYDPMQKREYERNLKGPDGQTPDDHFSWVTRSLSVGTRGRLPLAHEWVVAFAEADLGVGINRSDFSGTGAHAIHHSAGLVLRGAGGFLFGFSKHFGAYVSTGYTYAPVLQNHIGQTHDDGGLTFATGIRLKSIEGKW